MKLPSILGILYLLYISCFVVNAQQCPSDYSDHPLVVVSMDGFRFDYLQRGLTPNISAFLQAGVSAPYMKASYPTLTFPNHYTIATGLYPESHGIIANSFYDPNFDEYFYLGDANTMEGKWWGGSPIWNTVVKQGKLSATYFWPGSDAFIEDMHPTYYYPYDGSVPYQDRIDQVLTWLSMPVVDRPSWICVYFDEPDHTGHSFGPDAIEVNDMLVEMDVLFQSLIDGIANLGLTSCVNIILLSDHGMTQSLPEPECMVVLADYVPDVRTKAKVWQGAFSYLDIYSQYKGETEAMREAFTCQQPEFRQFDAPSIPVRNHYSNNDRIGDIVFDVNQGYSAVTDAAGYCLTGNHGYDNYYADMQPIFIAGGPDFVSGGAVVEPFQNIELYNLMCTLMNVNPFPNNGTEGSLYSLLKNPPPYPVTATETFTTAQFPSTDQELLNALNISGCAGDLTSPAPWLYALNMTPDAMISLEAKNLPWGIPLDVDVPANLVLLYQDDHVTGFSQTIKMPLWTAFTVGSSAIGSPPANWSSDVRLNSLNTPTCQSYANLEPSNITMEPLFPTRYSASAASLNVPFLVSNAIPMTIQMKPLWLSLVNGLLASWIQSTIGTVNVVVGPVFDDNADSLVDDFTAFTSSPTLPSHLFLIATRCLDLVTDLSNCNPTSLDVISFIYPEYNSVPNCLTPYDYANMFSARVKDVEIATGLTFYPGLSYEERIRLELKINSQLWSLTKNE